MQFASPYYLYALIGLAVPIAIHLWNRKQGKIIKVGSIKLLMKSETNKMNNLKLSEWFLLLMRLSLLTILVFIMSGLIFSRERRTHQDMLTLIDPTYLGRDEINTMIDTTEDKSSLRVFDHNFPALDDEYVTASDVDYWHLMGMLDLLRFDSIVIYSPLRLSSFKGVLQQIPSHLALVSLPEDLDETYIEKALWKGSDILKLIIGSNNDNRLSYANKTIPISHNTEYEINILDSTISLTSSTNQVKIESIPKLRVGVNAKADYQSDMTYLESAFQTLEQYDIVEIDLKDYQQGENYDLVIWLDGNLTFNKQTDQVFLELSPSSSPQSLITKSSNNHYQINSRINPKFLNEKHLLNLPQSLYSVLHEANLIAQYHSRNDKRSLQQSQLLLSKNSLVERSDQASLDLISTDQNNSWLWLLFVIIFIIERVLSINKAHHP